MDITVVQTDAFAAWHVALKDLKARIAIARRIDQAAHGNLGDCVPVGAGVLEMRIHVGAGYRVYFTRRGGELVVLLCGGDKGSQSRDIQKAQKLAVDLKSVR